MARRDFRQFGLADSIVRRRGKRSEWLDRLDAALDWPALETIVAGIYASREGGPAYPLLTYVKLLLLQQWYGLSDEGLEAAVDDRLSFRRFAGIPLSESVPDHSSVWRFREELAKRGLAEGLLAEVNRQLDAKGLILRRGTLIDATILDAAVRPPGGDAGEVSERDPEAGWTRKNGKSRFGYEAHVAVDEGSGIVRAATMTRPTFTTASRRTGASGWTSRRATPTRRTTARHGGPASGRGASSRGSCTRRGAIGRSSCGRPGSTRRWRRCGPGRAAVRDDEAGLRPPA